MSQTTTVTATVPIELAVLKNNPPPAVIEPLPSVSGQNCSKLSLVGHENPKDRSQLLGSWPNGTIEPEESREDGRTSEVDTIVLSKRTTAVVISSVACTTGISSMLAGIIVVILPVMTSDLGLDRSLLLWPASIFALTCGCSLLLAGALADVLGSRPMYFTGCVFQSAFTLGCGLSRTGAQLLVFRALAGVAAAFCLPSAVSIITHTFAEGGRRRTIAFASMGAGQPVGFSVGLTLGGVFADTIGWRWSFHLATIINTVVLVVAAWGLPSFEEDENSSTATTGRANCTKVRSFGMIPWARLRTDVDWLGAGLASSSLALFSYVLAALTHHASSLRSASNIIMLILSVVLAILFIVWTARRERANLSALVPPSLWRSRVFSCICIAVFVAWGAFNAFEQVMTLYFQYVQRISALESSLRFLPSPIAGTLFNMLIGLVVHRIRADSVVAVGLVLAAVSPVLIAVASPGWSYWAAAFPALTISPAAIDALFTVSNLIITSAFPSKMQAVAGGVFNTVAQIGKAVGLATVAAVAASVTDKSGEEEKGSPQALLEGYRAAMWYCFALNLATLIMCTWGLRKVGKVGVKTE